MNEQEIDLSQLPKKLLEFINYLLDKFFDVLLFIKKNIIILLILIVVGISTGILISKATKEYTQRIIVTPNFKSIDYLYNKIDLVNAKLIDKDSVFFKTLGIKNYKDMDEISIEPIIDIYKFIEIKGKETTLEFIKLVSEDNNVNNIIKDKNTSKNFKNHLIQFKTSKALPKEDIIDPLMKFFNDSEYYTEIKKLALENSLIKLRANDSIIVQIDKILEQYSKSTLNKNNDHLIYYNENNNINDLIEQKKKIIEDKVWLEIDLLNESQIVKEVSITSNAIDIQHKFSSLKYILPIFLVVIFILIKIFVTFYKSQIKKRNLS